MIITIDYNINEITIVDGSIKSPIDHKFSSTKALNEVSILLEELFDKFFPIKDDYLVTVELQKIDENRRTTINEWHSVNGITQ